jgi:hypothetical protein
MKSLLVLLFLVPTTPCFASDFVFPLGPHPDRDNDQVYRCTTAGESFTCKLDPDPQLQPCRENDHWWGIMPPPPCRFVPDLLFGERLGGPTLR